MEVETGAHFGVEGCDLFGRGEEVEPVAFANLEGGLAELVDQRGGETDGGEERG